MMKKCLLIAMLVLSSAAYSQDEPRVGGDKQADPVFQDSNLAIRGYDPVAFFLEKKPIQGRKEFEYRWMGATWRFKDAANRDLFMKDSTKYAPQYGGYCAYGMAHGYAAPIDPAAWSVIEGKLYLNYNREVRDLWNKDIPGYIAKADENWPKLPKKPLVN
jgi:hypothetical protein